MGLSVLLKEKTIKIVIIENNKLTRLSLKSTLNKYEDISIIGDSEDLRTGQMIIEGTEPDVALIDLSLYGRKAIDTISKIRAKNKSIKIIVLTPQSNNEEALNVLMNGANAYCIKTIDINEFVNLIRDITDNI